jgi:hypothetical protein
MAISDCAPPISLDVIGQFTTKPPNQSTTSPQHTNRTVYCDLMELIQLERSPCILATFALSGAPSLLITFGDDIFRIVFQAKNKFFA